MTTAHSTVAFSDSLDVPVHRKNYDEERVLECSVTICGRNTKENNLLVQFSGWCNNITQLLFLCEITWCRRLFFMTETATRTSCRGLGEAGSVAEPTTSTTRRLPPFFRPLLTLLGIREQEQEVVSSSDGASALPPSSGPSGRRQSDDRPNTDRMGNCLKSPTSDDVSLLREGPSSRFGHR